MTRTRLYTPPTQWTPEMDEVLQAGAREGYSTTQVAIQINERFPVVVTRNAVIGRAHRIGTQFWARSGPRFGNEAPVACISTDRKRAEKCKLASTTGPDCGSALPQQPVEPVQALIVVPQPKPTRDPAIRGYGVRDAILLMPAHGACRWPVGDPKDADFHFCCDPCLPTQSYCDEHKVLADGPKRPPVSRPAEYSVKTAARADKDRLEVCFG